MKPENIVSVLGAFLGVTLIAGASSVACNHAVVTVCREKGFFCRGEVAGQSFNGTVLHEGELNTIEAGGPGYVASGWETTGERCSFVCVGFFNNIDDVEGDGFGAFHIRKKPNAQPCP